MDQFHLFTPDEAAILRATAAGWVVGVCVLRRPWLEILTSLIVGELTSSYFAVYAGMWLGIGTLATAFLFGAIGMFLWSAIFTVGGKLSQDPLGTIQQIWRIRKGGEP